MEKKRNNVTDMHHIWDFLPRNVRFLELGLEVYKAKQFGELRMEIKRTLRKCTC